MSETVVINKLHPLTLPLQGLQVIEASAGTGKTWTLAALYVRLVLGHAPDTAPLAAGLYPPQILVMTFTEAATAELRGRIRARLAQAAQFFQAGLSGLADVADADDFLRDLRAAYPPAYWPACAHRLDLAAQWMDDAAIFTIHGWSSRMLKTHAFDSASLFQQSRVEDSQRLKLIAVQDYWRQWFYPLPLEQLAALKPLGKTPDELLDKLEQCWAITDKAPGTITYAGAAPDVLLQQWNAWQVRCSALEALARPTWTLDIIALVNDAAASKSIKGYRADWLAGWLEQMANWALGESIKLDTLARFSVSRLLDKKWLPAQSHAVFAHIEVLCLHMSEEPTLAEDLLLHAAQEVGTAYRQAKAQLAQFDFSDLLQCLYHALQAPDGRLARAIHQQFPIALVDEFQDTDPWQYGALSKIYATAESQDTGLIMIGDPKQAIYSFRGADLNTYLTARNQAQAIHTLSGNFRSTAGVVAAVNHVFLCAEKPFDDVPFEPVVACNAKVQPLQFEGRPQVAMTVWHQKTPERAPRKAVFIRQMAELFASQMVSLLNQGAAQPGAMAVLVRNGHEARAMRDALSTRGVRSVYLSERDSVFATLEATDLWRLMRAVANPRATALVRAALATRLWGLSWLTLEGLFQDEAAWDDLVDQFHGWQKIWQRQGFLPMLHHLLHDQSIPGRLLAQDENESTGGERRLTNLLHLGDLLQTASASLQGEGALIRYLEEQLQNPRASGDAAQLRLESDANLVQVITLHKAKGLQYPLVFLPFVSNFMAEKKDSGKDDALRLAEDVRLLYVALTRAETALWLGVAHVKGDVDGAKPQVKSALSRLLKRQTAGDLGACLQQWAACADICVTPAPDANLMCYMPPAPLKNWKPVLTPQRLLISRWWTASFSALTRDIGQHGANTAQTAYQAQAENAASVMSERDQRLTDAQLDSATPGPTQMDVDKDATATDPTVTFNRFPAGSAYGTLLHDLLEWQALRGWPIGQTAPTPALSAEWAALLARKIQPFNLDEPQRDLLAEWLQKIAQTPLVLPGTTASVAPLLLGSLTRAHAWPEMAFTLPVHKLGAHQLDRLIRQHVLPGQSRPALQSVQLEGMLIGFMDVVLVHEGRYYVLDYKSNRLPAYGPEPLQQAILAHRYDVQYTLYVLALHRLLKSRLPNYDYERHVGGALYWFLRGVDQPGAGLYAERPAPALIHALDLAFSDPARLKKVV